MPAEELPGGRRLSCAWCQVDVVVCSGCDHGQRYCSHECRQQGRRASVRRCAQRYQSKAQGRCKHAARQRRYRARRRQQKIVTHQGSQELCAGDVLQTQVSAQLNVSPAREPVAAGHCHWCERALTGVLRRSFLRHGAFEDPLVKWMKGVAHGQSP